MNRKLFYKKVLRGLVKADDDTIGGNVPFTNEEIQVILSCTQKLRSKALIHFLASTVCRPAALTDPVLRMKHLVKMDHGCYAVRIYDNDYAATSY